MQIHPDLKFPLFKLNKKEITLLIEARAYLEANQTTAFLCYALSRMQYKSYSVSRELQVDKLKQKILNNLSGEDSLGYYLNKQDLGEFTLWTKTYEELSLLRIHWIDLLLYHNKP